MSDTEAKLFNSLQLSVISEVFWEDHLQSVLKIDGIEKSIERLGRMIQPAPETTPIIRTERMSDIFTKHHLQIGKFPLTLHHFTGPDMSDPHDHPYTFTSTVLAGGYVEQVWKLLGPSYSQARWVPSYVERLPGASFRVDAQDIHRIVELPQGECITAIRWHDAVAERHYNKVWRFDSAGRAEWRYWNVDLWVAHDPNPGL